MSLIDSIKGIFSGRDKQIVAKYRKTAAVIGGFESAMKALSNEGLKEKTKEFKLRLEKEETLEAILPEAFALVREAAVRTLNQRHYDVQLIGGMIMHSSGIAEMKTGEGKTLVATLPAYLNALTGKGVHIVTVNDYLSRRDAVWMGQIFSLLGLSVGVINHETSFLYDPTQKEDPEKEAVASFKVVYDFLRQCSRREAYEADITYGTNNEFGFDYLRDNLAYDNSQLRQREFNCAIIDEIDSILIDEARTPLIISQAGNESENLYATFAGIAKTMQVETDFTVDEKRKAIVLTDEGISKAEKALNVDNIYTTGGIKYVHHLENAVRAKALFLLNKDYVIKDGEIIIVDEFTGRLQAGRRWSEGLHQSIEAKEGVTVQRESRTAASITYQNYFKLYKKLSGMTGTAKTSEEEFYKVYGLDVIEVPTNKKIARLDKNDLIFQTEKGKFVAIAKKIKELNEKGQPVLVGTVSIEKNELLSLYLKKEGIAHQMLNAKPEFAEKEGEIVANAGRKGAVTIATNMAGRGVDIKLGGPLADIKLADDVKAAGGLFVLGTERHEARRIDNQLRGRSGRQGDPGETQFFVSLEDELMRVFATDTVKNLMGRFGIPEEQPIENFMVTRGLESAQTRIEGFHFDARRHVLDFDNVMNEQRRSVYERRRRILLAEEAFLKEQEVMLLGLATDEERIAIEGKKEKVGPAGFLNVIRNVLLQTIDLFWIDHLEMMDHLRSSVNLRGYGQRDPLIEYRREGLMLYKQMQASIDNEAIRVLHSMIVEEAQAQPSFSVTPISGQLIESHEGDQKVGGSQSSAQFSAVTSTLGKELGRNDKVMMSKGGEKREMKVKKVEEMLKQGWIIEK